MPLFEAACQNPECELRGIRIEHYYPSSQSPMEACDRCGQPNQKSISGFGIVFTGAITRRYNDPGLEGSSREGHWAWRRKSARDPRKPEPVFIDTFDKQRDFCRSEGCVNPKEMPRNYQPAADGKGVENTRGLPGSEI